jgi:hypothetical protein
MKAVDGCEDSPLVNCCMRLCSRSIFLHNIVQNKSCLYLARIISASAQSLWFS